MKRVSQLFIFPLLVLLLLSSCVSRKDVLYFQDLEDIREDQKANSYNTVIRPDDLLTINVSALNPETVIPFNPPLVSTPNGDGTLNGVRQVQPYLVDKDGTVEFPVLGSIKLGGKTRQEAIAFMKEKLSAYLNEPIVNMRILNFTVSVLGEVQRPGTFTVNDERVTILEALGLAGDMTIFGERDNVQVIREEDGITKYGTLDFTSVDVVKSPFYYLKQNDVVIVPPNGAQIQSSGFSRNTSVFISVAGIIISVIGIFARR